MFFQKGIELTQKDIVSVIHTGRVEQTPVASSFIETVERELGIVVVACYVQSYERMVFRRSRKGDDSSSFRSVRRSCCSRSIRNLSDEWS